MSQVQLTRTIVVGGQESKKETITQLKPESDDKSGDIDDNSRYSDSPQWGFYVSM